MHHFVPGRRKSQKPSRKLFALCLCPTTVDLAQVSSVWLNWVLTKLHRLAGLYDWTTKLITVCADCGCGQISMYNMVFTKTTETGCGRRSPFAHYVHCTHHGELCWVNASYDETLNCQANALFFPKKVEQKMLPCKEKLCEAEWLQWPAAYLHRT